MQKIQNISSDVEGLQNVISANLFAGINFTTEYSQIIIIDQTHFKTIYTDSLFYDIHLPLYKTQNGSNQESDDQTQDATVLMYIEALIILLTRMNLSIGQNNIQNIKAISVSAHSYGFVQLDPKGQLTNSKIKLWNDFSTIKENQILLKKMGGLQQQIQEVGNRITMQFLAPKLLHELIVDIERYQKTTRLLYLSNYINFFLTEQKATDPGNLSFSGLFSPLNQKWSALVQSCIDSKLIKKFPKLLPSKTYLGKISKRHQEKFGFNDQCMATVGSGEIQMIAIGSGNIKEGLITIQTGYQNFMLSYTSKPFVDGNGEVQCICDAQGHYLAFLPIINLMNGFDESLKSYNLNLDQFQELVQRQPIGNNGKLIIPWWKQEICYNSSEIKQPIAINFQIKDFKDESVICRAILEGLVLNLYHLHQMLPVNVQQIRITGPVADIPIFCQTISDVFGIEVVPIKNDAASLGAAVHALWSYEVQSPLDKFCDKFIIQGSIYKPNYDNFQKYKESIDNFEILILKLKKDIEAVSKTELYSILQKINQD